MAENTLQDQMEVIVGPPERRLTPRTDVDLPVPEAGQTANVRQDLPPEETPTEVVLAGSGNQTQDSEVDLRTTNYAFPGQVTSGIVSPIRIDPMAPVGATTGKYDVEMVSPADFISTDTIAFTKRKIPIIDYSKEQPIISIEDAYKKNGEEGYELTLATNARGYTYKDLKADPLPDGSYPTKTAFFYGPVTPEQKLKEANRGKAISFIFATDTGQTYSQNIPYEAISESYLQEPENIDAWFEFNLPFADKPEDGGLPFYVTNGNEQTSQAIFAKRFINYFRERGMSERNIAGILTHRINIGRPITLPGTDKGSDMYGYGDFGIFRAAPTQGMRMLIDASTFILGEGFEALTLYNAQLHGATTFGYNLSTSQGREAFGDRLAPRLESIINDHYASVGLDISYAQAEQLSRFFASPVTALTDIAVVEKGASGLAGFIKKLGGGKERALFFKFRKEQEAKYPDSTPEEIMENFSRMRERQLGGIPYTDVVFNFRSEVVYDKILKVPLIGKPLATAVDIAISKPAARINGIRTSSRMKAGMSLEEAALPFARRPRVAQFMRYRRDLIKTRAGIRNNAASANRTVTAGEQARIDDLTRKINRSRDELRAVIARSELPEFLQSDGLDAAIILGSAAANTVSQVYGGDYMLWEFIGGMGGMSLYGMGHGAGSAVEFVRNMNRGKSFNPLEIRNAVKLAEFLRDVPTDFRDAMIARARYFDELKLSLAAEGVPPELLEQSAANIFRLNLLQTLEEGLRISINAPGAAQLKEAQRNLMEVQQQSILQVAELRNLFKKISRQAGAQEEGSAANKLFETVNAAIEHGQDKIKQLEADLEFIDANFENVTVARIIGTSDALGEALTPDASKNWDTTLHRLYDDGITILSPQELVKKGNQIIRKERSVSQGIVDRANQMATRLLPSAEQARKTTTIAMPDPLKAPKQLKGEPKENVLPTFERPEDLMALMFENARAASLERASLPYKSLNGQIFRTPGPQGVPVVGKTVTDMGDLFDGVMAALGKADNIELQKSLNPNGASASSMSRLLKSLSAGAEASLAQIAAGKGVEVDEVITSAKNLARQQNRYDEFFPKNIPTELAAVNFFRQQAKEGGVDVQMMPLDFLQTRELRSALNNLSFKATQSGNKVGAAEYTSLSSLASESMKKFVVIGEDGTRTPVGNLMAKVTTPDGREVDVTVNEALRIADKGYSDHMNRHDKNVIVGNWLGIGRFADEPRVSIEPSADFPLGMNYGNVPTSSWFNVNTWASKSPDQALADFRFVERAIGVLQPDGTYRVDTNTANGKAFQANLGAIYRSWVINTLEGKGRKKLSYDDFNRISEAFEASFRGIDKNGNEILLIDTQRQFRKLTEFSEGTVGEKAFESAKAKIKDLAKQEARTIKREVNVVRRGIDQSIEYLSKFKSEDVSAQNLATTLIEGGPIRIRRLREDLKTRLKMTDDDVDLVLRTVLTEAIETRVFKPTGTFVANVSPDLARGAKKVTQEFKTDIEELKRLMGYGDPTIGPLVRDMVGEKAYKTYTDTLGFMSNQQADLDRRVRFTGIPRSFSVESYISRFYAVNRGVVSLRYVGTEAVLQQMRNNNMSMMTQIIKNPRIGELFLEMVRTGKPLPFDKEVEFRKLLVIGYERYMSTKQPEPLRIRNEEGHEFIIQMPTDALNVPGSRRRFMEIQRERYRNQQGGAQ